MGAVMSAGESWRIGGLRGFGVEIWRCSTTQAGLSFFKGGALHSSFKE